MSRQALVPLVALAALLAGCMRTIDSEKAEQTISSGTAKRTGSKIVTVDCPSDQTAKKGRTFTCRVVAADGTRGDVRARVTSDQGTVTMDIPFRNSQETERGLAIRLTRRSGRPVSVDCPDIIARRKGVVFTCVTVAGTTRGRVRARQVDDNAKVQFRALKGT